MRVLRAVIRPFVWFWEKVQFIRNFDAEMTAVYGDNPNGISDPERAASGAAILNQVNAGL